MTFNRQQALKDFETDGFVVFRDVIDGDLIREASDHVEWLQQRNPELRGEHLAHEFIADDPFWVRLISDDRLLDIAETFIGPDIALFASHYISKPPRSGQPVLWHQDGSYWALEPMNVVTLWLSVDRSNRENGCMRVIPGTHTSDLSKLRAVTDRESVLGAEMEDAVDESKAVDLVLEPGDVEVHHPNIVHGSEANLSEHRRAGLTIRYIPTTTRITKQPWPCAFLFRGQAVPGVNDYLDLPRFDPQRHFPFRGSDAWNADRARSVAAP